MSVSNSDIAFVPTMGALHDGHVSLIKQARSLTNNVVVSIFVNPLQFESSEDLEKYPRDLELDSKKALAAGATRIWAPTIDEIYPENLKVNGEVKKISAGDIGNKFEGAARPGHFDGVLTVINQLFKHIDPRWAIFGEKDFQQLHIVKNWVTKSHIPVEIITGGIIRDSDGLALSSRNVRLTAEGRNAALVISRALRSGSKEAMGQILATENAFSLDYAEVIDPSTFEIANSSTLNPRAIIAGWIEGVRLLDNMGMAVRS
jgi:pantoate--beta-alanine ligase